MVSQSLMMKSKEFVDLFKNNIEKHSSSSSKLQPLWPFGISISIM